MTTTEPSNLTPATAETVRDPNWVAAHLRAALASEHPIAMAGLVLRDVLLYAAESEEFVSALTDRPSMPAVRWARHYGPVTRLPGPNGLARWMPELSALIAEWEHPDFVDVAQRWSVELRLPEVPDPSPGSRAWHGVIEGWSVRVWVITDRAAFDAAS